MWSRTISHQVTFTMNPFLKSFLPSPKKSRTLKYCIIFVAQVHFRPTLTRHLSLSTLHTSPSRICLSKRCDLDLCCLPFSAYFEVEAIARSDTPLEKLRDISQNFPQLAHVLSRQPLRDRKRVENSLREMSEYVILFLNCLSQCSEKGSQIVPVSFGWTIFLYVQITWIYLSTFLFLSSVSTVSLFERLRVQMEYAASFSQLDLPNESIIKLLSGNSVSQPSLRRTNHYLVIPSVNSHLL